MIAIMWVGIQRWIFDELDLDTGNDKDFPFENEVNEEQRTLLKNAYNSQTKIGWDHFIVGRIATEWSTYYTYGLEDDEKKDGKVLAFARDIVKAKLTFTLSVWTSHNEKINGKDNKYSSRDAKSIQKCIKLIYGNFQNHFSQEDQWLFREEARIRCNQPIPQMIGWRERALLSLVEVPEAEELVLRAKRLLQKMSISSIFDLKKIAL